MFNLMPKDTVFYDLFEGMAQRAVASAEHLRKLAQSFPSIDGQIQLIRREEHDADEMAHQALERLDRTFITPFDREDIHDLVNGLDNIVDSIDALAKRINLFKVKSIETAFQKQTDVLVDATKVMASAVLLLRKSRKLSDLGQSLIEIHRLENVGDDINHAAIQHLFSDGLDPLEVMKWKELYDRIEHAIDNCEDVSHTLERIVLKNG